jgi:MFS family permease
MILQATSERHEFYYIGAIIYGFAIGSVFPSIQTLSIRSVPGSKRSIGVSVFFVLYDFGTGVGTIVLGVLAGHFNGYRVVFNAAIVATLIIFLSYGFFFLIPKNRAKRLMLAQKED